ncbi:transcriptional regulator [Bacteroides fluxus]|uniref:transcriptional regulator n=1 Tax=Bacteroides fluxus TaxID=626930 RepID=UPI0023F43FD7|nr:transcriptional regulator [Bacteroides fluxus]
MSDPNKSSVLKPPAYGFETSPDGQEVFLCRYKKPSWKLRLDDASTDKEKLAVTLRKAAEWLTKRNG